MVAPQLVSRPSHATFFSCHPSVSLSSKTAYCAPMTWKLLNPDVSAGSWPPLTTLQKHSSYGFLISPHPNPIDYCLESHQSPFPLMTNMEGSGAQLPHSPPQKPHPASLSSLNLQVGWGRGSQAPKPVSSGRFRLHNRKSSPLHQ